ncbi:MAG: DUF928 domain-containing protein [Cyanobacteria bacterium P01_H01_bin.58]
MHHNCKPRWLGRPHLIARLGWLTLASGLVMGMPTAYAQLDTTLNFEPPPMTTPGNREAGGGRNDTCADTAGSMGMVALVPETNTGLTLNASPDLFVYVPPNAAATAELRIFHEATGDPVYAGEFTLPENVKSVEYPSGGAIVKLPLDAAAVTLESGESYIWAVLVVCDRTNRAADIVVDVGVQSVSDDYLSTLSAEVSSQLAALGTATEEDKVLTYNSAGLWQDLLSTLSELVAVDPEAYESAWTDLLTAQGMAAIADDPIFITTFSPIEQ